MQEVIFINNFGIRSTGILRETYAAHLNTIYARNASGQCWVEDVQLLKSNKVKNWTE